MDQTKELAKYFLGQSQQAQGMQSLQNNKNSLLALGLNTLGAIQQGVYNRIQQDAAMKYNSAEAAANRAWQERMSNTSYQRAMADMEKQGLILYWPTHKAAQALRQAHTEQSGKAA